MASRSVTGASLMALLLASCGSGASPGRKSKGGGSEVAGGAPLTAPITDDQPAAPDASGCNVQLWPAVGLAPAALAGAGPWQLCGAYGTGGAHLVSTSYDARRIALLTDAGQVWVLAAGSFEVLGVFAHGAGAVSFAGLSPDGTRLATVDDVEGRVALWSVASRQLLRVMTRPPAQPSYFGLGAATFSHDGGRLAVVSAGHVDVFDLDAGAALPISSRRDLGGAMSVAFAAGDSRLVLGRFKYFGNGPYAGWGSVELVDATTGDNRVTLDKPFAIDLPTVAVSGNGNTIALGASQASRSITFFDAWTGKATNQLPLAGKPLALDVNGARLAMIDPPTGGQTSGPIAVSLRNAADGSAVATVSVPPSSAPPRSKLLVATPDLRALLVGDVAPRVLTRIRLGDGRTHAVACGAGHATDVAALAISTDGQTLVSTGDGGRRLGWDVATGAPVTTLPTADKLRSPRATSPDGKLKLEDPARLFKPTFDLLDVATGAVVRTLGPQPSRPRTFDFAPDGARIASSSERDPVDRRPAPVADVWTVGTGAHEQSLRIVTSAPETSAQAVLFSDAGHLLVAGYATTARWCRTGGD
jgi:WD40 repeat protein